MSITTVQFLLFILSLLAMAVPLPTYGFDVLGCSYHGGSPNNFINCVQNSSNNRINDVRNDLEGRVRKEREELGKLSKDYDKVRSQLSLTQNRLDDALASAPKAIEAARAEVRNSMNYANSLPEQLALQSTRALPTQEIFRCLERSGAIPLLHADIKALGTNPAQASRQIGLRYWEIAKKTTSAMTPDNLLSAAQSPDPRRDLERALATGTRIASADPVARCAASGMAPALRAMLGEAERMHTTIQQESQVLFEQQVKPVIERAMSQGQNLFIMRLRQNLEKAIADNQQLPERLMIAAAPEISGITRVDSIQPDSKIHLAQSTNEAFALAEDIVSVDIGDIASRALVRGIINTRLDRSVAGLDQVLELLRRDPASVTSEERTAMLVTAKNALRSDPQIRAAVEIEIMTGILKGMGTNYIGSNSYLLSIPGGGKLVDLGYEGIRQAVEYGFLTMTEGLGVATTGGTIVGAFHSVYKGVDGSFAADVTRTIAKDLLLATAKAVYGKMIDDLTDRLKAGAGADLDRRIEDHRANSPGFPAVFDFLQSKTIRFLASSYVNQLEERLDAQLSRVDTLIQKAVTLPN